jgi:glutathione synthase
MKSLFVMDPLDRLNLHGDSTYVTMRECTDRGMPIAYCTPDRLFAVDGVPYGRIHGVRARREAPFFEVEAEETRALSDFDVVWMRKDPPFDMTYIFSTYLLDLVPRSTLVVNDPAGLKLYNEKLWAMRWPQFQPSSLLSNDKKQILAFVEALDGQVVLKPWDGNGGRGIVVTHKRDRNLASLIELHTQEGRAYAIAQAYLPGIVKGDKRILLFDGEPVAGVLRVPSDRDHRGNIHVGARVEATELTEREHEICAALGPELRRNGLVFVGIDVIDGTLTEINVTSPTGIQEANRLYGKKLESELVDVVARKLAARRAEL